MNSLMGKKGMDAVIAAEKVVKEAFSSDFDRRMQYHKAFSAYDPSMVDLTRAQMEKGDAERRWIGDKLTGRAVLLIDEA